ncbi:MAG: hypothetical protein V4639_09650 [Pseudomonadota bacterium]
MSQETMRNFLDQFTTSKERIQNEWLPWMQDSAKVATASFPKPPHSVAQKIQPLPTPKRK